MNTILNSLSEADKNKSFLTIYKDGADFDIKLSDFASAISAGSLKLLNGINLSASLTEVTDVIGTISPLQLSTEAVGLSRTVNLSAGATNPRLFNVAYTINNSGAQTGTLTGIFLNATETALNGITHNLMNLQVGGVNKFVVKNTGEVISASNISATTGGYLGWEARSSMRSITDGRIILYNFALSGFDLLQLGGTTSSFPAIKRNGAAIDFRLADDSAYAAINTGVISSSNIFADGNIRIKNVSSLYWDARSVIESPSNGTLVLLNSAGTDFNRLQLGGTTASFPAIKRALNNVEIKNADDTFGAGLSVGGTLVASAILQADSTTKGFLMPRMTQAQILLIATPANGLMVYNTDINTPCFYDGGAATWKKVSHSNM